MLIHLVPSFSDCLDLANCRVGMSKKVEGTVLAMIPCLSGTLDTIKASKPEITSAKTRPFDFLWENNETTKSVVFP